MRGKMPRPQLREVRAPSRRTSVTSSIRCAARCRAHTNYFRRSLPQLSTLSLFVVLSYTPVAVIVTVTVEQMVRVSPHTTLPGLPAGKKFTVNGESQKFASGTVAPGFRVAA